MFLTDISLKIAKSSRFIHVSDSYERKNFKFHYKKYNFYKI